MRSVLFALVVIAAGCSKSTDAAPGPAPAPTAPAKPGEARRIAIEAGEKGFVPDTIKGKPGEKLVLVFTRTIDGDCMSQVKFAGEKPIDLPKDKAVDVPVTVPKTGSLQFACAMDMNTGMIVAGS